jgi:hypothetical protein
MTGMTLKEFFKNLVKKSLGTTDISAIGDGTLTGAVSELNSNLVASDDTPFRFGVTEDGEYGYITTDEGGADTVVPFKSKSSYKVVEVTTIDFSTGSKTISMTDYDGWEHYTTGNFFIKNVTPVSQGSNSAATSSLCLISNYNAGTGELSLNSSRIYYGYGYGNSLSYTICLVYADDITSNIAFSARTVFTGTSNEDFTVDITPYKGWKDFTLDNFMLNNVSIYAGTKITSSNVQPILSHYDANNGILYLNKSYNYYYSGTAYVNYSVILIF